MRKNQIRGLAGSLLAAVVIFAASGPASAAGIKDESVELGAFLNYVLFDGDLEVDNSIGFGGRVGYNFTKEHEIEFTLNLLSTEDDAGLDVDVDFTTWTIGYVYNWADKKEIVPFVTGAIGSTNTDVSGFGDEDDTTFVVGGGVRLMRSDAFAVRLGGSLVHVDADETSNNWTLEGGLTWFVGGKGK